ncbi:hypothetical protein A2U01_0034291 [Trifolium medium]|uniref:Uncharacterized protein n=1 Tax=Trifolium medium TaxID=97028 RepID=A0A392PQI2_9FABA|nr:hypothetical protein [Trifolium medium]
MMMKSDLRGHFSPCSLSEPSLAQRERPENQTITSDFPRHSSPFLAQQVQTETSAVSARPASSSDSSNSLSESSARMP